MIPMPECCWPVGAMLGEGPLWSESNQCLWFVDILGCRLHRYSPATNEHASWTTPSLPGFTAELADGGLLVGLAHGLYRFVESSGSFEQLAPVEAGREEIRINDGAVGPDGCLWFGTKNEREDAATGGWFRWCGVGEAVKLEEGYVVTNGPAFSPEGRTLYHCDSMTRRILARTLSPDGALGKNRLFAEIEAGGGYPDGLAVDIEGCLWVGLYAGHGLRRYSPAGQLIASLKLPCMHVTKPAFGGPDGSTLFITTASFGLSEAERAAQPLAGGLFRVDVGIAGLALPKLKIS